MWKQLSRDAKEKERIDAVAVVIICFSDIVYKRRTRQARTKQAEGKKIKSKEKCQWFWCLSNVTYNWIYWRVLLFFRDCLDLNSEIPWKKAGAHYQWAKIEMKKTNTNHFCSAGDGFTFHNAEMAFFLSIQLFAFDLFIDLFLSCSLPQHDLRLIGGDN